MSFVEIAYYFKKELNEHITDDYPWIREKLLLDCMIKEAKENKKALEKK